MVTTGKEIEIQWIKFGDVESVSFIGKETIIIGYGNYIIFYDTSRPEKKEVVYRATNDTRGDGVQCLCTHRSLPCFAMSERCRNPRILINAYPSFENMRTIDAIQETGYVSLRFSEMEYLIALTGLPNYSIVIWNWRTSEKLICQDTSVKIPKQYLRVSLTSPIQIAQVAPEERTLVVWDLNVCYKKAVISNLSIILPDSSEPPFCYAWGYDGDLYFSDSAGNLYSISSDTRTCELAIGWTDSEGRCTPCLTWYKGGWVLTGPEKVQFCKRKSPEGWCRIWSVSKSVPFKALISSSIKEILYGWNEKHELILFKGDTNIECITTKSFGADFDFVCFLHPVGDVIVTYGRKSKMFSLWNKTTGEMVAKMVWEKHGIVNDVKSNPCYPYILVIQSTGVVSVINMYDHIHPMVLNEMYLTKDPLDTVRFHVSGTMFCVANTDLGVFFLIKLHADPKMEVMASIRLELKIVNFALVGNVSSLMLLVLPMSQLCCRSGQTLIIYSVNSHRKTFQHVEDVSMPTVLSSFVPRNDTELFCAPHRSRMTHTVQISTGMTKNVSVSGHQMKSYSMQVMKEFLVTYGFDGLAIVRSVNSLQCVTIVMPHHRIMKGIKNVVMDPYCQTIISLGVDGTLVSFGYSGKWCNTNAREGYENLMKSTAYRQFLYAPIAAAKAKARALEKIINQPEARRSTGLTAVEEGETEVKTWLEIREQEKMLQEKNLWKDERNRIIWEINDLREKLKELVDKNLELSTSEQLPISSFDLDRSNRQRKIEEAKAEREREKHMQHATIKARDKISEYIKKMCWDSVSVKGRELQGIVSPMAVESYPLIKNEENEEESYWRSERLKIEQYYRKGDYFEPWIPRSKSMLDLHLNTKTQLSDHDVAQTVKTKFEEDELDEHNKEESAEKALHLLWSGTGTHNFIQISSDHYSQFEITSYTQGNNEISLILADVQNLMVWFNKQFDEVFQIKEREVASIIERNNRLRHIINELNFFHFSPEICRTLIIDPKLSPYEQPHRILKVQDAEMTVSPYITQSQQELIDKQKAEAERLRLLLLADDFKEKALITMMDGVLEKLWENEIKKDIPKPKCMLEREPENYTEDDHRAVRNYEEAVRFLLSERERYRKILEADWAKVVNSVRDIVNRFDERLAKLNLLKMKVESAICQELLKALRIRNKMQEGLDIRRKEERIREEMCTNEKKVEAIQIDLSKLLEVLNDCKNYYETLQNRDRNMDKNFKKEFPDSSPIIVEQLYKLSKKRPKQLQKAALFSTLLLDLGKAAVACNKPEYLTGECIQYLKDIDALDNNINAPASVSEQIWEQMCKMRRAKIDLELKVRACAVDLGEAEITVAAYQKRLKNAKEYQIQLQNDIQNLKQDKLYRDQNYDIQLVLKHGLVEVPLSGRIADFEESILVSQETLTHINGIIRKAGNQKIRAMQKAANFRKGIIFKEWEHKKLRMEIEDLQDKLNTIEKIKVTKELQSILVGRARGFTEEKGFLYLADELAAVKEKFQRTQADLYRQISDYNTKLDKLNLKNEDLDSRIAELNVDVNELSMEIDKEFDDKQLSSNMKRMKKVRYRSKLVQKIQEQHNEILMLQTELELLRLRTFPTLKNKT